MNGEFDPKKYCAYIEVRPYEMVKRQESDHFYMPSQVYACILNNMRCVGALRKLGTSDESIDREILERCPARRTIKELAVR